MPERRLDRASKRLIVFVKAPRPGQVKTRLIAAFGAEPAALLYRLLAEEVIRRTTPAGRSYERALAFTPADARPEVEAWLAGETLVAQAPGDLGERMAQAFERAFDEGARQVVLIGSDAPTVSESHISRAFAMLRQAELVLGPARDGGYYLIGLKRPRPRLFADIPWSTPSVLQATLQRAAELRLSVGLLELLADVDSLEDVASCWPMLQPILARAPKLRESIRAALSRPGAWTAAPQAQREI
jgi:rSAM/selenodomain-associated transferase 1